VTQRILAFLCALFAVALVPQQASAQTVPGPAYRINPGDDLEISVWGDDRLQRVVRVLPDGTFGFPLVGTVMAAGQLPSDIQRVITAGLRPQYKDVVPQVTVLIKTPGGYQFSVIGKVKSPGTFTPGRYVNALEAIGIAGGFAHLGALGQAVAGPPPAALPDTAQSAAQPQVIPASLLAAAGNVILAQFPLPTPPGAPDAAKALFPLVTVHTFQAVYGLPEYRWQHNDAGVWNSVAWDGDTQPMGNSIYDEHASGPGKGPNQGFGDPHVYVPRGGYRERRPVSTLGDGGGAALSKKNVAPLVKALRAQARAKAGAKR